MTSPSSELSCREMERVGMDCSDGRIFMSFPPEKVVVHSGHYNLGDHTLDGFKFQLPLFYKGTKGERMVDAELDLIRKAIMEF